VHTWQGLLEWTDFWKLRWAVERERSILHTITDKSQRRIREKLALLRIDNKGRRRGGTNHLNDNDKD
jgi:hypothetical protein